MTKKPFYGRKEEFKKFQPEVTKQFGSMYAIKGRRRVGKSYFIENFAIKNNLEYISISGMSPENKTKLNKTQIQNFCELARLKLNDANFEYPDWNSIFYHLAENIKKRKRRSVLLLDEISWMASDNDGLLPSLKTAWDDHFQHLNVVIFLCGSVSAWIEDNIVNSSAFVGRLKESYTINELKLKDCVKFWSNKQKNSSVTSKDILKILCITGGIPKYLEEVDQNLTAEQNIQKLFYNKSGFLFQEFEKFFNDSFSKKSSVYKKILKFLLSGKKNKHHIEKHTKITGGLDSYLKELKEGGFIKEEQNFSFSEKDPKDKFYSIKDNYCIFYLKYIEKLKYRIEKDQYKNNKSLETLTQWKTICGFMFENIVKNNVDLLIPEIDLTSAAVSHFDSFIGRGTKGNQGFQIDLLIEDIHGSLFLCEFKMRNEILSGVQTEVKNKIKKLISKIRLKIKPKKILVYSGELGTTLKTDLYFDYKIDFEKFIEED